MPDEKDQEGATPSIEGHVAEGDDDITQLRAELAQLRGNYEKAQSDLTHAQEEKSRREREFNKKLGQQGQELGHQVRQLKDTLAQILQPDKSKTPKTRFVIPVVDPVERPDDYKQTQAALHDLIGNLQEQIEELRSSGGQSQDVKALRDELTALRYQQFLDKEEVALRTEYGLSDDDVAEARDLMANSGYPSLELAVLKLPHLKRKMFDSYAAKTAKPNGKARIELADEGEEMPEATKRSRVSAKKVGEEILRSQTDGSVPRGGGRKAPDENLAWREEMLNAVEDGSFFDWPEAKQKDYANRAAKLAATTQRRF